MNFIDKMVERFIKLNRRMKRWQRVVSVMAAVVVFATTYALILPAITLDRDTATTQAGIEVAASENEPEETGTVFESEQEEEPAAEETVQEEEPEEAVAEENSSSESGSQDAEAAETDADEAAEVNESDSSENESPDESEQTEVLTTEEAATYGTTEEAIAAVTGQTAEEVKLITEDTRLTYEAEDYFVYADFGESAKLPEGVQLRVKEITRESDPEAYEAYYQKALSEMQDKYDENVALSFAKFYDIAFVYEGVEIEPSGYVNVKIEYKKAVETEKTTTVDTIHSDKNDEHKAEVIDSDTKGSEKEVEAVEFKSDQFSVYGIIGAELYAEITLPGSNDIYVVTVTAPAEAKIPQGSTLRVEAFEEGSEKYEYARNAVLADKKEKGEFVDIDNFGLAALDISIIDPDGNEIEPSATVQVDIKIKELPGVEDLEEIKKSLEIQHHVEIENGVVVEKVFDGSNEGSFRMDTNEKVAEKGTAVDPNSVSEEDFRIDEEESSDIDASFDTEVFSTFTISWNYAYGNGVVVHYVDQDGNELDVANSVFPTSIGNNSSNPAYLIYDIDGYEYDHAYRRYYSNRRWNEQNIVPELRRNRNGWRYSTNGSSWSDLSAYNATNKDEIYVVYKKKADVTQGGSPTLKPVNPEDYPEEPGILKESDPNGDGTSDLSLSITGHTKDREVEKLADVIVVFDVSGSMDEGMSGSTRIQVAKNAVNGLVDTLAEKKDSQGNPLIRMSLISFSTSAEEEIGLTDLNSAGVTNYKRAVNNLSTGGGTNWDYALQLANEQAVDSGRATFVIFVTDGDPTFRNTRMNVNDANIRIFDKGESDQYYFSDNVFGIGYGSLNENNNSLNFDAAVNQGKAIVAANKNLYSIGISNSVTAVSNFNSQSGGQGAYLANEASELNKAFDDIAASIIAKLGFSDIQMTDGITEMTQTVDKSGLTTTDGSFTYWKKAKDATAFVEWDPASEGCLEAEYDEASGAVKWNMGTNFMPEDGATYKVTWKVWPSQEAYDILAKCKNDPSYYDTLTDAQKAQITRTGTAPNYSYTLRTNEPGAGTTYKSATKSGSGITTEGDPKSLTFNEVDPLGLASSQISIKKIWDNQLDGREVTGSYTFPVEADGTDFGNGVVLSSPTWQNDYYISTGLMTTDPYVVYEHGHDYTIEEPADLSYQWDFKADVYHPMVINNQTKILIKVDSETESDYTIDGKYYKELSGEAVLMATNERRSNLNISKTVVDKDGNHIQSDQAFTFTVTVDEGHDDEVWLSAYDSNAEATVMDPSIVSGTGVEYQSSDGYFHAPSGTTLTLTIKDGWNYRFTNLSVGSTYSIEENSPVPDGFTFVRAEATASNNGTAGTVTGQKTEGTIDKSNSVYTAAYTNRANTTTLKFRKTDENGTTPLAGAVVEIVKGSTGVEGSPFTTTTEDIELTLFDGIYRVKETKAPDGYNVLAGDMYFKTVNGTVTITDQDGNEKTYEDFTMDTEGGVIVLKLKNHPGQELPMTGGPGTLLYTLGGLMMILASAMMYGFRMRRGERRIN